MNDYQTDVWCCKTSRRRSRETAGRPLDERVLSWRDRAVAAAQSLQRSRGARRGGGVLVNGGVRCAMSTVPL